MPDYKRHDPKGWGGDPKRGAALGRPDVHDCAEPELVTCKLYLRRIRLDSGGYDSNGTYFGCGEPLFWCTTDGYVGVFDPDAPSHDGAGDWMTFEIDFVLRAWDRAEAKQQVLDMYPNARFYR